MSISLLNIHSSVTYPALWRCGVSCGRCGYECGRCAFLKEMIHLQWEPTASPTGDLLASPNFGICDTTQYSTVLLIRTQKSTMKNDECFSFLSIIFSKWISYLIFYSVTARLGGWWRRVPAPAFGKSDRNFLSFREKMCSDLRRILKRMYLIFPLV